MGSTFRRCLYYQVLRRSLKNDISMVGQHSVMSIDVNYAYVDKSNVLRNLDAMQRETLIQVSIFKYG